MPKKIQLSDSLEDMQRFLSEDEHKLVVEFEKLANVSFPEKVTHSRDFVSNALLTGESYQKEGSLKEREYAVAESNHPKVPTKITLSYKNFSNLIISGDGEPFTFFDKAVLEALVSLYLNNNTIVTASSIYKVMIGKVSNSSGERYSPSPDKLDRVEESVRKMRFLDVTFETEGDSPGTKLTYSGNMINADEGIFISHGHKVHGFFIKGTPLVYSYASLQDQVSEVPLLVSDIPLNKSDDIICLREFISNEIEMSKTNNRKAAFIRCNSIYDIIYGGNLSQKKKDKVKSQIREILNYWISIGYILSYDKVLEKTSIVGYEVSIFN